MDSNPPIWIEHLRKLECFCDEVSLIVTGELLREEDFVDAALEPHWLPVVLQMLELNGVARFYHVGGLDPRLLSLDQATRPPLKAAVRVLVET